MAIITHHGNEIELLDAFRMGGEVLATIRAKNGKPYVGGDVYPVRTEFQVVRAAELVFDRDPAGDQVQPSFLFQAVTR